MSLAQKPTWPTQSDVTWPFVSATAPSSDGITPDLRCGPALPILCSERVGSPTSQLLAWFCPPGRCVCVSVFETTCVNVSAPINSCVFCSFFSAQIFSSVLTEKAFKSQRKRLSFWTNCCPHSTFSRWASCLFFFFWEPWLNISSAAHSFCFQ